MSYGWNSAPTKAKFTLFSGDAAVFEIGYGAYEVSVPVPADRPDDFDPPAVTFKTPRRQHRDVKALLPNMDVDGDTLRIPVTDLVPLILDRLDPVDLARALWNDDDVKAAFMDCLVTRYNEQGIGDNDRRKFLAGVKEAVHAKALDALANAMSSAEYHINRASNFYDQIRQINAVLRERDIRVDRHVWNDTTRDWETSSVVLQFDEMQHKRTADGLSVYGDLAVGGRGWEEAREFWRKEVLKQFPMPPASENGDAL